MYKLINALKRTIKRELKRMISRPIYLLTSVGVMGFSIVFFLTFFTEGQPVKLPIAIVDNDNSSFSRQFIRNLRTQQHVDVMLNCADMATARHEMQKGNVYAILYFERDFYKHLILNKRPTVCFYVNNAYMIAGSLTAKDLSYMCMITAGGIKRQVLRAKGFSESQIMGVIQPLVIDMHAVGNPWINYGTYLLNVLLPVILHLMCIMLSAFVVGVELKSHSSAEWMMGADNHLFIALIGKLLPYTVLFVIMGCFSNILLYKYMHFPLHSSILWMFLATLLLVVSGQALGVLFVGLIPVLRDAITISGIVGTLSVTAAGATFPVEQLPYFIQIFTQAFPIRHYFLIYVNRALYGADVTYVLVQYVCLGSFVFLPLLVYNRLKMAAIKMNYPIK